MRAIHVNMSVALVRGILSHGDTARIKVLHNLKKLKYSWGKVGVTIKLTFFQTEFVLKEKKSQRNSTAEILSWICLMQNFITKEFRVPLWLKSKMNIMLYLFVPNVLPLVLHYTSYIHSSHLIATFSFLLRLCNVNYF